MSTIKSSSANLTLNADGSGNDIKFQSNAVEKASIDQDGNVVASGTISSTGDTTITNGDIVFATAGKGICLGVTSNTDSNTLSDYETGDWTPTYVLATAGDSSWTYDRNAARYTKIGRQVFFEFFLRTDAYSNSTGSGSLKVSGLPFASSSTEFLYRAVCIRSAAFAANNNPINGHINTDETKINLNKRADANEQDESLDETSCTNGTNKNAIYAAGSYTTD